MKQDHNAFPQLLTPRLLRIPQREVQNFMPENSSQLSIRGVSLQRSQANPSIPLLALQVIQIMLFNVFPDKLWDQVADALAPSEGSPDFCGWDVIGDPLVHQVDVVLVFPQHVGFVDEFLSIISGPRNTYEPIVAYDFGDVLTLPQIGDAEGLQYICPTQQLYLWHIWEEKGKIASRSAFLTTPCIKMNVWMCFSRKKIYRSYQIQILRRNLGHLKS